jgi:molybdopterin molybdotransferase
LINKKVDKFNHVRFKGSDYKKNEIVLKKNSIIQPNHILTFKTLGIKNISVKKKINILFFSTGNEISNQDNIPDWKVRNSNCHYIKNLDQNFLFNFKNGGILRDSHQKVFKTKITKMLKSSTDIIITSGAVSAGKFDFVPDVIRSFKLSNFFKGVAIRPGKPILFAKIEGNQKVIFGLPGNPMSSAACFRFFVYPYIENILGLNEEKPLRAILKNNFTKKESFVRFAKSKLNTTKNGKLEVEILEGQESYKLKSFVKSNIWALLPAGKSKFKKGEIVECFFPNHSNSSLI